ncbi:MAG: TonB-dependent receptor, partial [Polyangiaceae bacterium]
VVIGGEIGLRREFRQGAMFAISYGLSVARFLATNGAGDLVSLDTAADKRSVANSPVHLASLKGALPVINRALLFASRLSIEGPRYDRYENRADPAQGKTGASVVWDLVFSGEEARYGVHYAFGVYNAFDWRYSAPVSTEFIQRTIQQPGRSYMANLDMKF